MKGYWKQIIPKIIKKYDSPIYVVSWGAILEAIKELSVLKTNLPIHHFLSLKTQPVAHLLRSWRKTGYGVEIVSEFEFKAALKEGFEIDKIIVNGVAKYHWLKNYKIKFLNVHIDSINEYYELKTLIKRYNWNIGLRIKVTEQYDSDEPKFATQFGLSNKEVQNISQNAREEGINIKGIHFHQRSNLNNPLSYKKSILEVAEICKASKIFPKYIDCGGGLPVTGEKEFLVKSKPTFDLTQLKLILKSIPRLIPSVKEIYLENGRFITARSGILVIKVLDIKRRPESNYLICDGGRTNNALVSDWQMHEFFCFPKRSGKKVLTTVCGTTCMAYDRLFRATLSNNTKIGDYIIWMNAGAYHIPWETRFSNGFIKVIWIDENNKVVLSRESESFKQWWSQWKN